jgi:hypothetical protein
MYQLARNKTANPESTCQRAMGDDFASTTSLLGLADTIRRMDDHSPLVDCVIDLAPVGFDVKDRHTST